MTTLNWQRSHAWAPIRRDYLLFDGEKWTGIAVCHCQHPTALRPYYLATREGVTIDYDGRKYCLLADAQAAAESLYQTN